MADEPTPTPTPEPTPTPAPTPTPEPQATAHPLDPGGERFKEVYRDMQDARRETARLAGELDALKAQQQKTTQQQQAPKVYTASQLQAEVDAGRISQALMADQLAWQRAQEAKGQVRQELVQEQRTTSALSEVNAYIDKIPALNNTASADFAKVRRAADDVAAELGRPITDPIVQRRALREVYGSLDRVTAATSATEHDRTRSTRFADTGGGGGSQERVADPLKNIPRAYVDHWDRMNYTPEQRAEEAKYIKREPRPADNARR